MKLWVGLAIGWRPPRRLHLKILIGDFNAKVAKGYFQTENWE